ncbi:MAG TPA: nuclear transport factor 2 family protein [Thermodesulfobacteriota bacterium]|nr:nuclear transport factor 2 family protein [Thermodesulfobacteriota bacterium]
MKKNLSFFLSVFILLLVVSSCGKSDEEEIEELLSKRQKAFETKNVELYLSCISPEYKQKKDETVIGVEEIKKGFITNVSVFDRIELSPFDRNIYQDGDKAEVFQKVKVNLKIEKEENQFVLREKLGLEKVNGKWFVVKESDADFLKGFVFGG